MKEINLSKILRIVDECISQQKERVSEIARIIAFVEDYRTRYNIIPTNGYKPELSCYAFGEFYNLLYRQLVLTINGDAGWKEIENDEIRKGVLEEIKKK